MGKGLYECYISLPMTVARSTTYCRFNTTAASAIYDFLKVNIVRGKCKNDLLNLNKNYYKKSLLATSWSQESLAKVFNSSQGAISKHIKTLAFLDYIQIRKHRIGLRRYNIYILGQVKFEGKKTIETFFMEDIILGRGNEEKLQENSTLKINNLEAFA